MSVTQESPHTLYRASAGSGKTHKLSSAYIARLLDGEDPGAILATTFTRKAAGEILQRVLKRLALGVVDDGQRRELARDTDRAVTDASCAAALRETLDQLPRLSIQTIDSFFHTLAAVYSFELGLPPVWGIIDEESDEALREDAIDRALDASDRNELIELLRELQGRISRACMASCSR